jgi:hypothetical protein
MILATYYSLVCLSCAVSFIDWRKGLLLCLVIDVVRDPMRKLVPGQPVHMTLAVTLVWLVVFLAAATQERHRLGLLTRSYPELRTAAKLIIVALIPAAILVVMSYPGGWQLAAIGSVSYLGPFVGVVIGFLYARTDRDVKRFLAVYALLNAVILAGALFEFCGWPVPALGGLEKQHWIRTRTSAEDAVKLMCGFFRSPDGLGQHAASVLMFAVVLGLANRGAGRWRWLAVLPYAAVCLLLSGRRKMVVMPLILAAVYLASSFRHKARAIRLAAVGAAVFGALGVFWLSQQLGIGEAYFAYAQSSKAEGVARIRGSALMGAIETVRQHGILGCGLGTATQGAQHLDVSGISTTRRGQGVYAWQEDGVSRLVMELGVIGTILVFVAGLFLARSAVRAVRETPAGGGTYVLAVGLAGIVAANLASFAVSHQAYSGDPSTVLIVTQCFGMLLACPQLHAANAVAGVASGARSPHVIEGAFG